GETSHLALVSDDSCEFCAAYIDGWEDRYQNESWAVIHGSVRIDIHGSETHFDEERQDEWTAIDFELTEPAAELYSDGEKGSDEGVKEESTEDRIADLSYDGTAQSWKVEWTGKADSEGNTE